MASTDFGRRGQATADDPPPSPSARRGGLTLPPLEPAEIGWMVLYAVGGYVVAHMALNTVVPYPKPPYARYVYVPAETGKDLIKDEFKSVAVPLQPAAR